MKRSLVGILLSFVLVSTLCAVDLSQTAASVVASSNAIYLQVDHYAIATIAAGQPVYQASNVPNPSATTPDIGLANAAGTGDTVKVVGIAGGGAAAGQPVKVILRDPKLALGVTCVAGDVIYLSPTGGGKLTSTYADLVSGNYVCVLGIGNGTGTVNLGASQLPGTSSPSKFVGVIRADVAK